MKNLSVRRKLLVGFLIVAVFTAVVGATGIYGLVDMDENAELMFNTAVCLDKAHEIETNLQMQGSVFRDAILHLGEPQLQDNYLGQLDAADRELDELAAYLYDNVVQREALALLAGLEAYYTEEFTPIRNQFIGALQEGRSGTATGLLAPLDAHLDQMSTMASDFVASGQLAIQDRGQTSSRETAILTTAMVALSVLAVAVAILLGRYISKLIALPIRRMAGAAEEVARGNVEVDTDYNARDELGDCAAAFRKLVAGVQQQAEVLRRVAMGDYTVVIPERSEKDITNQAINAVVRNNNELLTQVREASTQVSAGAGQISQGAQSLAAGTSEQASTVEQFSAALTELLEQTKSNASHAKMALEATETAGNRLDESTRSMGQMLEAMAGIDEASSNVAKIIKVIEDIAFQTNILSLNAAVEAARAGQHGKGFAVVADEVRNLAAKSAEAAKETAALIDGSLQRVQEGNHIVEDTNASLKEVARYAAESLRLISEIAHASEEQTVAIAEIDQGIGHISQVVQENSSTAEQSAASAQQMNAQSALLQDIVNRFKLGGEAGLSGVPIPDSYTPHLQVLMSAQEQSSGMRLDSRIDDKY